MMVIVSLALMQNETEIAQKYLRKLVELDPAVVAGDPCELVEFLLSELITDDSADHEAMLKSMFAQFPQDFSYLSAQYEWVVRHGFLWKAIRAVIWDRVEQGRAYFKRAAELKAVVDEALLQHTTYHLLGFEHERGSDATLKVLSNLRILEVS